MAPTRILFDTNAFSENAFEQIVNAGLETAYRRGHIAPIYSGIFIEETLQCYGSESKRRDLLHRWLPLIFRTCDRVGDDLSSIIFRELVQGVGKQTDIRMEPSAYRQLKRRVSEAPEDGSWHLWQSAQSEHQENRAKADNQREIAKKMRGKVAAWKKAITYQPSSHGVADFKLLISTELISAGRQFIPVMVELSHCDRILDRWSKHPERYPYTTTFVRDILYAAFYAMTRQNAPLDRNAQADLNLLSYLNHADMLVTNERGFMRTAFFDLWKPVGKSIITTDEFASHLKRLLK